MTAADGIPAERAVRRRPAILEMPPLPLIVLAEAAWISILAGLAQEFSLHQPEIGLPILIVFVAAGAAIARLVGRRLGERWPLVAVGLVVAVAVGGVLASGAARTALASGIGPALAAHPGGLFAGLALFRGFAHARLPLAESTLNHLLAVGIPGIAVASLVGGLISEPFRARFLGDALTGSILFIGATVLALAFTRLGTVAAQERLDWRRNPVWLVLMLAILLAAIAAAIPLAAIAGPALSILFGIALGPLVILGLLTGIDPAGRRILIGLAFVAGMLYLLSQIAGGSIAVGSQAGFGSGDPSNNATQQVISIGLGGLLAVGAVAAILFLAAIWLRRTRPPEDDLVDETRTIDHGEERPTAGRVRRRLRRPETPGDAVEAYIALLGDLARQPEARRQAGETPTEHAARLRSAGAPHLGLDLLAADYALVRDGGRRLSAMEHERAIRRWRTLRRDLARWARVRAKLVGATAEEADVPVRTDAGEGRRTGIRAGG